MDRPDVILDRLGPHHAIGGTIGTLIGLAAGFLGGWIDQAERLPPVMRNALKLTDEGQSIARIGVVLELDPQTVKRTVTVTAACRFVERRVFLPAGLKPVSIYADSSLVTAARHGRLNALRFARRWYTTDHCVYEYAPRRAPRKFLRVPEFWQLQACKAGESSRWSAAIASAALLLPEYLLSLVFLEPGSIPEHRSPSGLILMAELRFWSMQLRAPIRDDPLVHLARRCNQWAGYRRRSGRGPTAVRLGTGSLTRFSVDGGRGPGRIGGVAASQLEDSAATLSSLEPRRAAPERVWCSVAVNARRQAA